MKNQKTKQLNLLNRFTSLPVLLDILHQKHLVLLDPQTWEDRNDAYYMQRYKEKKELKSFLALCFSNAHETFHHWKVFSPGISGVCIEFDREKLISAFKAHKVRSDTMRYELFTSVEKNKPPVEDWPYIKRHPYKDEKEFRALYESTTEEKLTKEVTIQLSCINKITLSPWMPQTVAGSVIKVLRAMPECKSLKIIKSTLLESSRWKRAITPKLKA